MYTYVYRYIHIYMYIHVIPVHGTLYGPHVRGTLSVAQLLTASVPASHVTQMLH